jgi:hypothetical protein
MIGVIGDLLLGFLSGIIGIFLDGLLQPVVDQMATAFGFGGAA